MYAHKRSRTAMNRLLKRVETQPAIPGKGPR
jgi:hypothetical protein